MKNAVDLVKRMSSARLTQRPLAIVFHATLAIAVALGMSQSIILASDEVQQSAPEPLADETSASVSDVQQDEVDERLASDNLLREMTTTGISLTPDVSHTLPTPTFVSINGELVDPSVATKSLTRIAGPQGVTRFVRDSVVAPLAVKTEAIEDAEGRRVGHFIDVAFVVHQSISEIRHSRVLDDFQSEVGDETDDQTIDREPDASADDIEKPLTRTLTTAELSQYGVTRDEKFESLGYLRLPIMSKVVLSGVARARRSIWSTDDESAPIILTWLLDARFGSASPQADSIANQWRPIERTEVGQRLLGTPEPYAGMGGYVAITPLPGDPAASLVQIRFVIHEPPNWFAGRNLLRSKLPLLIQDRVRNIRRELDSE